MAEPSIPVSAIRKALAEELASQRRVAKKFDARGNAYLLATMRGQWSLIRTLEEQTGTQIFRRPR
jgi:hypothetical protein